MQKLASKFAENVRRKPTASATDLQGVSMLMN